MNEAQTVFSIFYAVLYGAMLSNLGSLKSFPWGFLSESKDIQIKLITRLLSSIIFFNIIPFAIFSGEMHLLGNVSQGMTPVCIALASYSSLAVFIPYRIYHIILSYRPELFYETEEWINIKKDRKFRSCPSGHTLAALFYASPIFLLYIIYP